MTTFILKSLNFPRVGARKSRQKLSQKDRRAFQKQLSEIAQNGMFRK